MNWLKPHEIKGKSGTLLALYIQPGASKIALRGIHDQQLKISVQSPPVEGAANKAVTEYLSQLLEVSKSKIHLLQGETSRQKKFWVELSFEVTHSILTLALKTEK